MRWVLLDEVISIEKKLKAKTLSHVPSAQVSPEILMMEMMAQTGALLLGAENDFHEDLVFAKIESARFDGPFRKGDKILIEADSENLRPEGAWMNGRIQNASTVIAESRFLLMNVGHFIQGNEKPITFHDAFMHYFHIREKVKTVPVTEEINR